MTPHLQIVLQKVIQAFQHGQINMAELMLDEVLQKNINGVNAIFELGLLYANANRFEEALVIFCQLLPHQKDDVRIPYNLGLIHALRGNHQLALEAYDLALMIQPNDAEVLINKSSTCNDMKNYQLALEVLQKAIKIRSDIPEAWINKAVALENLNLHADAVEAYEIAIKLKPNLDWIYGNYLLSKMRICDWKDFEGHRDHIVKSALIAEKIVRPFEMLALVDDVSLQQQVAQMYVQSNFPLNPILGPISKNPESQKIRLAYFSADFRNHPVAFLIAELIEIHDRSRFELYGFSLANVEDEMRGRFFNAFDHFMDVESMSDIEIAQLSRSLKIDIAIDLTGFTRDSKTGIFAFRSAPIQVNYLGYPGTMGASYMDYIVADQTIIPPGSMLFYSEKIVCLPNTYQVNDRKRKIAEREFTRSELGLPDKEFVFCCFNNNFKILPEVFDGWMRILKSVEGSVLWLLADNPAAEFNLKLEAIKRGIDPSRLVFAGRMSLALHLSRHSCADLFLDTFPYNAHTTTSDALWAGLPVLTLVGQSFASRVAASLLNAIGLSELITNTQDDYEKLAIELATNRLKFNEIKLKLTKGRLTAPLFDTSLFAKNLEAAYIEIYRKYREGLKPDHIWIN